MSIVDTIADRNRLLFERCKTLGDEVYSDHLGLVLRPNVEASLKDRWGYDVVQSSVWYAVSLARWCRDHPENSERERDRLNRLVSTMASYQDRDSSSETYGNLYWRVGWTDVKDRNGISFWSPEAGLIYLEHRDLLTDQTNAELEATLQLCIEGLDRHRPRWQYTNIFLLNILSRLTLARALDRSDVLEKAENDWDLWFVETGKGGLTEYNSPTYIVTALAPLGRMLLFCREAMRAQVEQTLECLYADFFWHYHQPSGGLAGAMSRAYPGDWLHSSMTNHIAFQQLGEPHEAINLTTPFTAASEYLAPERLRAVGTIDKAGTTVSAAIPDLNIERQAYFGNTFALGVKSGPAYGKQELPLTIAYPGKRQHLVYLHEASEVRPATHAALDGPNALILLDLPDSESGAAPPHAWMKVRLGRRSEFDAISIDQTPWDGDYRALSSEQVVCFTTESLTIAFRVAEMSPEPSATLFLWNDYQTDQLTIEVIAPRATRVAIGIGISETGAARVSPIEPTRTGCRLTDGTLSVTTGDSVADETPLLDAPGFVWRQNWNIETK